MHGRVMETLAAGVLPESGRIGMLPDGRHLIAWGKDAPSGTPDAAIYIRYGTGDEDTTIYTIHSGAWAPADL